jgi:GTPase SAR1 family protein
MDQVLSACVSGDVASLETALESLPTAVKGAEALATPLHDAARQGHAPCVQLLLQAGASPDSPLGLGAMRPLHEAALYGNVECIKVLCLAGADPNSTNADCKTPLALAFDVLKKRKQDLSAVARTLVAYGATSDHNAVLNLTSLDISNLGLQTIPASLLRLPNLQHLQGVNDGNPLTTIPFNVKRAGTWIPEIKTYLQEIADSGRFLWSKAKVMVLGKEGSGKTHLLRCLQKASYERNESTNGIDINMFKLEEKELTWFDFGGQEIFYPTHQFFLTAYCVYLIVFRLNDSDYFERVQHWLQVVSQFAQDPRRPAKIVLVGTHLDAVSAKEAAAVWEALKTVLDEEGSAHITAMVSVSCKARTGLKELQAAILKAIELGGFGSHLVPGMYLQVWAELERLKAGNIRKLPSSQFFRHWKSEVSTCIFGALQFFMDAGQCFVDQGEA